MHKEKPRECIRENGPGSDGNRSESLILKSAKKKGREDVSVKERREAVARIARETLQSSKCLFQAEITVFAEKERETKSESTGKKTYRETVHQRNWEKRREREIQA